MRAAMTLWNDLLTTALDIDPLATDAKVVALRA